MQREGGTLCREGSRLFKVMMQGDDTLCGEGAGVPSRPRAAFVEGQDPLYKLMRIGM